MIRQSPDVPAAVELADVSKHIMNSSFVFPDASIGNAWHWQSPKDFDPMLRVVVPQGQRVLRNGKFLIVNAGLAMVEDVTEYWVTIPIRTADRMDDDPYLIDFVEAFRQYTLGRTSLVLPEAQ